MVLLRSFAQDANSNAQCHQACNGLTTNQTRLAKSCGRTITWKCPKHGTGITKIIVPPPPVYDPLNLPSAGGKMCSVCINPIGSCYVNLAYHCEDPSCNSFCHLSATCGGFANSRGNTRARILSTRIWRCHLHCSITPSRHLSTQPVTSPARPTLPSLNSLLSQGMSLANAKNSKE